jgi:hypothetical protein
MKKLLYGFGLMALVGTLATGCTDAGDNRVGERPTDRERTGAASPATSPTTPPASPSSPSTPSSPGSTGTQQK